MLILQCEVAATFAITTSRRSKRKKMDNRALAL